MSLVTGRSPGLPGILESHLISLNRYILAYCAVKLVIPVRCRQYNCGHLHFDQMYGCNHDYLLFVCACFVRFSLTLLSTE